MRPIFAPVALLVMLALAVTAGPASAATTGCAPQGSRLARLVEGVREYTTTRSATRKTFVCSDATGKRARLITQLITPRGIEGEYITAIRFAGRYVAAGISNTSGAGAAATALIRRIDLNDGGQARNTIRRSTSGATGAVTVTDLLVNRKGWTAWIARTATAPPTNVYVVGRRDSRGTATLDSGPDIEPRSLADSGTTIYWVAHGGPQDQDLF